MGKTITPWPSSNAVSVHPHACGENPAIREAHVPPKRFTPTRVGKTRLLEHGQTCGRFTPTRVGKTLCARRYSQARRVHPHACGENAGRGDGWIMTIGSPPRVWGKRDNPMMVWASPRFTPTRVGKTRRTPLPTRPTPVHPHACGENATPSTNTAKAQVHPHACGENRRAVSAVPVLPGSPPRVWGKLPRSYHLVYPRRFTPTRVGKTS